MQNDAYNEGVDAAAAGAAEGDNPYPEGTKEHDDWLRGFRSAEHTDAFQEGVEAYGRGMSKDECPYPDGTDAREEWEEGWDQAEESGSAEE